MILTLQTCEQYNMFATVFVIAIVNIESRVRSMDQVGMNVEFNGKMNVVLCKEPRQYEVGAMLCELTRLYIPSVKDIIVQVPHYHEKFDVNMITDDLFWLEEQFNNHYESVIASMLSVSFMNKTIEYTTAREEDKGNWLDSINELYSERPSPILDYIFGDTDYADIGISTIGQFLLTVYSTIAMELVLYNRIVESIYKSDEDYEELDKLTVILTMLGIENTEMQHIDYRIMGYDGRYNSVYGIQSITSLLFFEMVHMIDAKKGIKKCRNCGHYFIPRLRSDTLYCDYVEKGNDGRTCKEIGAQRSWKKKEGDDIVTREYRKTYMKLRMQIVRHPENHELQTAFYTFIDEAKEKREAVNRDEISKESFLQWVNAYKLNNKTSN